jgi:hypothetical protein
VLIMRTRVRFEDPSQHTEFASGYFHPYINVITGG